MFEIRRQEESPITVIRAASAYELSNYEKQKLTNIEDGAQVNVLEMVKIETPSKKEAYANIENKTAKIALGELAIKNEITSEDISSEELFLIECSL